MKRSPEYDRWLAANIAYSEQYNIMVQDSEKLKTQYPSMAAKINTRLDAFEEFFQATDVLIKEVIASSHLSHAIAMSNAMLFKRDLAAAAEKDLKWQQKCDELFNLPELREIKDKFNYIKNSIGQ